MNNENMKNKIIGVLHQVKLAQSCWEYDEDIVTANGIPVGGTVSKHDKEFKRWWGIELFNILAKAIVKEIGEPDEPNLEEGE